MENLSVKLTSFDIMTVTTWLPLYLAAFQIIANYTKNYDYARLYIV